jgi:hypothetical protein
MKPDWIKELEAAADKFWKEEYPKKSFEQKSDYWKKTLEKGMNEQEKMGLPAFGIFNKAWYVSVKEQEPEIDKMLNYLFEKDWKTKDSAAFWTRTAVEENSDEDTL